MKVGSRLLFREANIHKMTFESENKFFFLTFWWPFQLKINNSSWLKGSNECMKSYLPAEDNLIILQFSEHFQGWIFQYGCNIFCLYAHIFGMNPLLGHCVSICKFAIILKLSSQPFDQKISLDETNNVLNINQQLLLPRNLNSQHFRIFKYLSIIFSNRKEVLKQ